VELQVVCIKYFLEKGQSPKALENQNICCSHMQKSDLNTISLLLFFCSRNTRETPVTS